MSDHPITEASTYTGQHNIQKQGKTSIPSAGFKPHDPTSALGGAATGIGTCVVQAT
jgi:hypothetical protein